MIKKLNKKLLIVAIISASASSVNANLIENTDITLRAGISKQDFMFDTPAAHSILDWQGENIGVGLDVKYDLTDNLFTDLELDYSKVKGGEAHDDDISNKGYIYSKGGVEGETKDLKLSFGYKFDLDNVGVDSFSIAPTVGGFYKNINYHSENKTQLGYTLVNLPPYGNIPIPYQSSSSGITNETDSDIIGVSFGLKLESKDPIKEKSVIKFDFLLPVHYVGKMTWHKRVPVLNWELENRKKFDPKNNNGFRIKYEKGYKINNSMIDYLKFYSSYEKIIIKNLKETEPNWNYKGKGRVEFEAFAMGIGLEF
jgi:hypothetical protein